jgi:predicted ATPase/class 3 adenylate cyclase
MQTKIVYTNEIVSLPSGTLTFLFTDIEASTRLWESYPILMKEVMVRHDALIEEIISNHQGSVVRPRGEGDSRFAIFRVAIDAVLAANDIQKQLWDENWSIPEKLRVRIALHTGEAEFQAGDYYGSAVNRCARLRNLAHGGQTLLSQVTYRLVREILSPDLGIRDLGVYILKDLKQPERIFQLITPGFPSEFPPLRTRHRSINNLPASLTSFVGREKEIRELKDLISRKRLLTISGPGGAGKTRLAIQVASELVDQFDAGGWFVDLAPVSDPILVAQYILNSLGIREESGDSPLDTLIYFFQVKSALMIIDNCEQVTRGIAELVEALISQVADLYILATSREPLGVAGETVWCIPPLVTPNLDEDLSIEKFVQLESVRLFMERAAAVKPQFTITRQNMPIIAQICARLDGIPLAIELAAARVKVLSVADIAARLDQRLQFLVSDQHSIPRQKTLRNLIDWSYDLLPENEQDLLRRLSVFAGGWTLPAMEAVCSGENIEAIEVLDLLSHLVDKSLVVAEISDVNERYRLLETIRQYAHERLVENEEMYLYAKNHAEYFTEMAERSYEEIWGKNQGYWIEWLETENDNLRAAMAWMEQEGKAREMYLRLAGSLWRFWGMRGYIHEGRNRLETALILNPGAAKHLRANGLRGAGKLALQQGDYLPAAIFSQESLDLFREINDQLGIARQLEVLGEIAYFQGKYSKAAELLKESLGIRKDINDKEGIAVSIRQLGLIARDHGDTQKARELFGQSLALFRELDDKIFTAQTLNHLGLVEHSSYEYEHANALFEEAASLYRQLNDRFGLSDVLLNLATVAKDKGDLVQAKTLGEQCLLLKQELGDKRGTAQTQANLAEVLIFQGKYSYATQLAERSLESFQGLGVKRGIMFCKGLLAFLAHYRGNYELALSLAEEGMEISKEIEAPRAIAYCTEVYGLVAFANNDLDEGERLLNQAVSIFNQIGDRRNTAITWINLARIAYRKGNIEEADQLIGESLAISRLLKIEWTRGLALEIKGLLERKQGNYLQSQQSFQESLEIAVFQDNLQGIANCLGAIAGLAIITDHAVEGLQLFATAYTLREQIGAKMGQGDQIEYEQYLHLAKQLLDNEQIDRAWSQGISITLSQAIDLAKTVMLD